MCYGDRVVVSMLHDNDEIAAPGKVNEILFNRKEY